LYIALPVALLLAMVAVVAFVVQVRNGQFDDLETPPRRMLFDEAERTVTNDQDENENQN
jgi:cbb3-type cytochrome oxidase maturation protein